MDTNNDLIDDMPQQEEQTWAVISHLGAFSGSIVPFGNIVLPLVIWLTQRDKSAFVAENARKALNFQIYFTIALIVSALLCIVLVGIPMVIAACILNIVYSIMAAVKASKGEDYEYPHTHEFVKEDLV